MAAWRSAARGVCCRVGVGRLHRKGWTAPSDLLSAEQFYQPQRVRVLSVTRSETKSLYAVFDTAGVAVLHRACEATCRNSENSRSALVLRMGIQSLSFLSTHPSPACGDRLCTIRTGAGWGSGSVRSTFPLSEFRTPERYEQHLHTQNRSGRHS